jgi:hypothetical protein
VEIDFYLGEMTAMRYYMPLIIEGNKRNIKSNIFVQSNMKYTNPHRYSELLTDLSIKHDFKLWKFEDMSKMNRKNPIFSSENTGLNEIKSVIKSKKQKIFILTYSGDFIEANKIYRDEVDYILMISKYFVDYYNLHESADKNLFFGSPKFDTKLDEEEILKKYNLESDKKRALVVYPRNRDLHKIDLGEIYSILKKHDFEIVVKTRGKDPIYPGYRGDHYFGDFSWYPHTTIELMKVSDIVINFGSGAIKECVMLDIPIIDFYIKPFRKLFAPLYDYGYAANFTGDYNLLDVENSLLRLTEKDLSDEFKLARKNHLYEKGYNSSKNILDFIENLYDEEE